MKDQDQKKSPKDYEQSLAEGSIDETNDAEDNKEEEVRGSDITSEDLEALGPRDLSMDLGDDELLKHREHAVDFSGDDLDIPGSELDDEDEALGSEDEENNGYSIGGDNHENLEEDQG